MPADTFSSFLGMTLQATGNNNNVWGTILNGSALLPLERAIAGNVSNAVTGGTLDLSGDAPPNGVTQVLDMLQVFTGALTSNQIVIVPNLSKLWLISNQTTGNFQLLMQTPGGTPINIPQGTTKRVACDGNGNLIREDKNQIGNFEYNTVGQPGTLQCNGASCLKTDFPDLYANIGTTYGSVDSTHFTLPLMTDTNRYLRAAGGSLAVGTYQANQNLAHTHSGASFSGSTGTESADHTHSYSGNTGTESASHTHVENIPTVAGGSTWNSADGQGTSGTFSGPNTNAESNSHTHAYSGSTGGRSAAHTHTFSGTTGSIPSSGGTEARPESLAVICSIRF
jgi:hypothetical protein